MLEINLRIPTEAPRILINCVNASIIKKKNGSQLLCLFHTALSAHTAYYDDIFVLKRQYAVCDCKLKNSSSVKHVLVGD